jgi:hypothetical protein
MIGQLLKKTKKTALSHKTEVSLISELIRYLLQYSAWIFCELELLQHPPLGLLQRQDALFLSVYEVAV